MGSALIWDDEGIRYDFGPDHPLKPVRVELTVELIRAVGLDRGEGVRTLRPEPFGMDEVLALHDPGYVAAVVAQSAAPTPAGDMRYGIGPGDTPAFRGMHEASLTICGASVAAAKAVWEGEVAHAFNPAGGLHHAMPGRAAGFCVYDDPAAAIHWLLAHGAERVAYIDVDTHHGDGVQAFFYDDPRVLTVSIHESGRTLFPGTGFAHEIGTGDARGTSLNLSLGIATPGEVYLDLFDRLVPPALDAFKPDVLVTQLGCDTHATDPLAHQALTTTDYRALARRLHELAHSRAHGRWVATGGGGYQIATVVPRAWTIYFAELTGQSLPAHLPEAYLATVLARTGQPSPAEFDDPQVVISESRRHAARVQGEAALDDVRRSAFDLLERFT